MPDVDPAGARRSSLMFPLMFWGGIGLAPLAALLILLGNGGTPVRLGAVLGVMAPVMIAVSLALRPDPDSIRLQFEETLLEELDLLRSEVREEIANSARTSHQMVGERLGALQHTVDTLRAAARATPIAPPLNSPPALAPPPYQVTASAAPPPIASRAAVPRSGAPRAAGAPPSSVAPPGPMAPRSAAPPTRYTPPASPAPAGPTGNGRASVAPPPAGRRAGGRSARHQADGYAPAAGGRATPPPGGVYRRADTGQIPRPAYGDDDGPGGRGGRGGYNGAANGAGSNGAGSNGAGSNGAGSNGAGYRPASPAGYAGNGAARYGGGQDWSPPAPRGRPDEPYEESWTDQKLRERYGRRPRPYGDDTNGGGEPYRQREDGHWEPVISAEPVTRGRRRRWEEDSSADLRGSRHASDTGTQPAYEDRWSAVRDEPNGYGNGNGNGYGNARPDYTRRALPAGSSEPSVGGRDPRGESWNDSWDEPVREARSHRYRPDFELTDERWR